MQSNDLAHLLEQHRVYLLRFANLQLRNETWAEDVVSETLLAALSKPQSFAERAQLKTWLVGILKHKIIDLLRLQKRSISVEASSQDLINGHSALFDHSGHFHEMPSEWGNPEEELKQQQFFKILEACIEKLPPALGRVFLMREWLEMSCEEMCNELQINSTNLYVQLHRARSRLRECLEFHWFAEVAH